MAVSMSSRTFGALSNGDSIRGWTLQRAGGLQLEVIAYGGTITRLPDPDREGKMGDVVLGFNTLDFCVADRSCFGAIVGRVAGRIAGVRFNLEGKTYQLARNDGANHIHGGTLGFNKRTWTDVPVEKAGGEAALLLTYRSPDGEEAGSIADHALQIHADEFVPVDEDARLLGRVEPVAARDNDFRQPRNLGATIPLLFKNHGDLYLTPKAAGGDARSRLMPTVRLLHPGGGRALEVSTTEAHLQLYTGCFLDGSSKGKSGACYQRYAGVCLECEGHSDGASTPGMGDIILRPGSPWHEITEYAFVCTAG